MTPGVGTTIAGASLGTIGQVTSVEHSGVRAAVVDVTPLNPTRKYRIKRKGTVDPGTLEITCFKDFGNGDPSKHIAAITALESTSTEVFTITLPDASTKTFTGYVKAAKPFDVADGDTAIEFTLTIKLTGTF